MRQLQLIENKLAELPEKDRRALLLLAVFFSLLFLYWILTSAAAFQKSGIDVLAHSREDRTYVFAAIKRIKQSIKHPVDVNGMNQSILAVVSGSAKKLSLNLKRVKPVGSTKLEVQLEDANFNNVLVWLSQLEKKNAIFVEDISVERSGEGLANVRLTLIR